MQRRDPKSSAFRVAWITGEVVFIACLIGLLWSSLGPERSGRKLSDSQAARSNSADWADPTPGQSSSVASPTSRTISPPVPSAPAPLLSAPSTADTAAARVAEIEALLDLGADRPTGQPFKLGPGGALLSAPTLRTALLDELARLDPHKAAARAKAILETFQSPDEWALCLRIVARADGSADTRRYLEEKFRAMLGHEPWRSQPTTGYLEAFDVAVYLGGASLLPDLTNLIQDRENRATAHAAYLAVDRLVINDPASALDHLESAPESMRGREGTRANYFARADVSDPAQRRVLERYLLSVNRTPEELGTFAGLYPNFNYMISHNLLTDNPTPDGHEIRRRDLAAMGAVRAWLGDARFEGLKPHLETIQGRLERFVETAK